MLKTMNLPVDADPLHYNNPHPTSLLTVHPPPTSTATVFLNRRNKGKKFDDFPVQTRPKWGWWSREVTRMTVTIMRLPGTFLSVSAAITRCLQLLTRIFALHMKERVRKPPMSRKSESQHLATHTSGNRQQSYLHSGTRLFFSNFIFSVPVFPVDLRFQLQE